MDSGEISTSSSSLRWIEESQGHPSGAIASPQAAVVQVQERDPVIHRITLETVYPRIDLAESFDVRGKGVRALAVDHPENRASLAFDAGEGL